ncbi:uncharacterized protein [Canis lupus baileyi]|uniref:uncharacterized protein n=1 Tax=Canis lupus baileyi TaxID=143281 RepID=UPI003B9726A6
MAWSRRSAGKLRGFLPTLPRPAIGPGSPGIHLGWPEHAAHSGGGLHAAPGRAPSAGEPARPTTAALRREGRACNGREPQRPDGRRRRRRGAALPGEGNRAAHGERGRRRRAPRGGRKEPPSRDRDEPGTRSDVGPQLGVSSRAPRSGRAGRRDSAAPRQSLAQEAPSARRSRAPFCGRRTSRLRPSGSSGRAAEPQPPPPLPAASPRPSAAQSPGAGPRETQTSPTWQGRGRLGDVTARACAAATAGRRRTLAGGRKARKVAVPGFPGTFYSLRPAPFAASSAPVLAPGPLPATAVAAAPLPPGLVLRPAEPAGARECECRGSP